jgi:hypothetical protein
MELNKFNRRCDDAEVTVTWGPLGGFRKYYVIWMVRTRTTRHYDRAAATSVQPRARSDHDTSVSSSEHEIGSSNLNLL